MLHHANTVVPSQCTATSAHQRLAQRAIAESQRSRRAHTSSQQCCVQRTSSLPMAPAPQPAASALQGTSVHAENQPFWPQLHSLAPAPQPAASALQGRYRGHQCMPITYSNNPLGHSTSPSHLLLSLLPLRYRGHQCMLFNNFSGHRTSPPHLLLSLLPLRYRRSTGGISACQ
jgi:hypothetical protein